MMVMMSVLSGLEKKEKGLPAVPGESDTPPPRLWCAHKHACPHRAAVVKSESFAGFNLRSRVCVCVCVRISLKWHLN